MSSPNSNSNTIHNTTDKNNNKDDNNNIDVLFTPIKVGALSLSNRIIMGPLTRNRGPIPSSLNAEYYSERASKGSLTLSEGILIEPQGTEWSYAPGIFNNEQIEGWKLVTDAVHKQGGFIVSQLWHLGRLNHPLLQAGQPIYGPSPIAAKGGKFRQLEGFE